MLELLPEILPDISELGWLQLPATLHPTSMLFVVMVLKIKSARLEPSDAILLGLADVEGAQRTHHGAVIEIDYLPK